MTRKSNRPPSPPKPADADRLAQEAADHLSRGRFKDAVEAYKRLLKAARSDEAVAGLARAYAGRAEQLAAKGMVREAIALWQNRAENCAVPLADARYFHWLLSEGKGGEVVRLYRQADPALRADPALAERLAALALAEGGAPLAGLAADDPLVRDHPAADEALAAWCRGDDAGAEAALARIPFRSPYRELRQGLKALLKLETDPAAAAALAARIPSGSAFAPLAAVAAAAAQPDRSAIDALPGLAADARTALAALKGWPARVVAALTDLARAGPAPAPADLAALLERHQGVLGAGYVREARRALAVRDRRALRNLLGQRGGDLSPAERLRLQAIAEEAAGDLSAAELLWMELYAELRSTSGAQEGLRCALILRHVATQLWPDEQGPHDLIAVTWLEQSLQHDPGDRESLLRLIRHHLRGGALREARQWVERALQQLPADTAVLLAAAEVAVAGGAAKKAAGFARQLLAIDPINSQVRGLLIESHLIHGRKLLKGGKPEAARREIAAAREWGRSAASRQPIDLLEGLIAVREGQAEQARALLMAAVEPLGGVLAGRFGLLVEAGRVGLRPDAVLAAAGFGELKAPEIKARMGSQEIGALARALEAAPAGEKAVLGALQGFAPVFTAIRSQVAELSRHDATALCEGLLRHGCGRPLEQLGHALLHRFGPEPLFIFYWASGRRLLAPRRTDLAYELLPDLKDGVAEALARGDTRTAARLEGFIQRELRVLNPDQDDEFDLLDDEFDPDDEADLFAPTGNEHPQQRIERFLRAMPPEIREVAEEFRRVLTAEEFTELLLVLMEGRPPSPALARRLDSLGLPVPSHRRGRGKRKKKH